MTSVSKQVDFSNSIKGVEIFAPGTHNGDAYTERDIDDMVDAAAKLDFRPAIKVGHTKNDNPGAPAYGYVENLRKQGGKLVADLTDMHDSVVDAIRSKAYDRLSSEIYFNLKRGGNQYRRALKAVALLGSEVPAVASLVPLHKMEFAAEGYESLSALEQDLTVESKALLDSMAERVTTLTQQINDDKEQNMLTITELKTKITELTEKMADLSASDDEDKGEALKALSDELTELATKAEAMSAAETDDAAETKRRLEASERQVAALTADARARTVTEKIAQVKIPALRPAMKALYTFALEHPETQVKVFSKDKDGKDNSTEQTLAQIADGVVAELNAQSVKLFQNLADVGHQRREEGEDITNSGKSAGELLHSKTKQYQADHPAVKSYEEAQNHVLTSDPALKTRYIEEQSGSAQARH